MQGAVADVLSSRYSDAALVGPPETGGQRTTVKDKLEEIFQQDLNRKASRNTNRDEMMNISSMASNCESTIFCKCLIPGRSGSQQASCLQSRLSSAPFFGKQI